MQGDHRTSIAASIISAFVLTFYIEIAATSNAGTILSLLLFVFLASLSIKNLPDGIAAAFLIAVLVPENPRDILDVYEALQVEKSVQYNVISSVSIGPGSLLLHLFLFNTVLCLLKISSSSIKTWKLAVVWTLFFSGCAGMFFEALQTGGIAQPGVVITDIKFPLIILLGLIQGSYLYSTNSADKISVAIYTAPLILGARVIFFLANDVISGTPKLDVMTHPLLSACVLGYCILEKPKYPYNNLLGRFLLYLSLVNASRGLIAIQIFILIACFLYPIAKSSINKGKRATELLLIGTAIVVAVAATSPRLFDFLLWKLSDIDTLVGDAELSGSGQVRKLELANITSAMSNPITFLVGKGFGGTFTFIEHPLPLDIDLDLKSFSAQQLKNKVFFTTHSFMSGILLKFGAIGLLIYFFIPVFIAIARRNDPRIMPPLLSLIASSCVYNYYWRIEYMLLVGILFAATAPNTLGEKTQQIPSQTKY